MKRKDLGVDVSVGIADKRVNWRVEELLNPGDYLDPDDELVPADKGLIDTLGFDPAELFGDDEA